MSLEGILASLNLRKITDKTQLDLWHWHEFDGKMVEYLYFILLLPINYFHR